MTIRIIIGDCLRVLLRLDPVPCIFCDPPDNCGLNYSSYTDRRDDYREWLDRCLRLYIAKAEVVWMNYNAQHTYTVGALVDRLLTERSDLEAKACVQTFTFGQHQHADLGNNHRPLLRLMRRGTTLYPDAIRVPSWRQENGDKRADPRGRVPGDVFDFARITGNSRQRRRWHPTQLHEDLVERCLLLTTLPGDTIIDPFAGTGTTLRVCKRIKRACTLIELDPDYVARIAAEHSFTRRPRRRNLKETHPRKNPTNASLRRSWPRDGGRGSEVER